MLQLPVDMGGGGGGAVAYWWCPRIAPYAPYAAAAAACCGDGPIGPPGPHRTANSPYGPAPDRLQAASTPPSGPGIAQLDGSKPPAADW